MLFGLATRATRIAPVLGLIVLTTCVTAPTPRTTGDISLKVLTSGANFDADGYTIMIDGVAGPHAAATFGTTVLLPELTPGSHEVTLSDLSGNCSVASTEPHSAVVVAATAVTLNVNVVCTSTGATISIITTTNSVPMSDPDGYVASVGTVAAVFTPNSGTTDVPVDPGTYDVVLSGIEPSCTTTPTTRTVTMAALEKRSVSFDVVCGAYPATTAAATAIDPPNDTLANTVLEAVVSYDLLALNTRYAANFVTVSLKLGKPVGTSQISGYIDFDLDELASTGIRPQMNAYGGSAPQGIEAEIAFQTGAAAHAVMLSVYAVQSDLRMVVDADSVVFYVPKDKLFDEGDITLTAIIGTFKRATDFIPNSGVIVSHRPPGLVAGNVLVTKRSRLNSVGPQRRNWIDLQRAPRW